MPYYVLQIRMESIEAVNKILEEANKRIQPTGTGIHLFCVNDTIISCIWLYISKIVTVLIVVFPTLSSGVIWGSKRPVV